MNGYEYDVYLNSDVSIPEQENIGIITISIRAYSQEHADAMMEGLMASNNISHWENRKP